MGMEQFIECGNGDLNRLLKFTAEIDKMTAILRMNLVVDGSRRENDAEHSWHIAVMAILFEKYAPGGTDIGRAVKMCVVHDLIEIYAGDTFAYDVKGNQDKEERERQSADRLFAQLPEDIGTEIRQLWEEFDAMETPDARYASCMDRIQPFLHNSLTEGHTWTLGTGIHRQQIEDRMAIVKETIPQISSWIDANLDRGIENGWLLP